MAWNMGKKHDSNENLTEDLNKMNRGRLARVIPEDVTEVHTDTGP